jgi:hypothetical protein
LALGEIDAAESAAEALRLAQRTQDTHLIAIATQQVATVLALRGQARSAALLIGYVDKLLVPCRKSSERVRRKARATERPIVGLRMYGSLMGSVSDHSQMLRGSRC